MTAFSQTRGRGWIQESYPTGSGEARQRAAQLRRLGYQVSSHALGEQVTWLGRMRLTLLTIRPGRSGDEWLEHVPPVEVMRRPLFNPYMGFEKLKRELARRPDVYDPAGLAAWIGRRKYGHEAFQRAAAEGRKLRGGNPEPVLVRSVSESAYRRRARAERSSAQAAADALGTPVALVDQTKRKLLTLVRPRSNPCYQAGRLSLRPAGGRMIAEVRK